MIAVYNDYKRELKLIPDTAENRQLIADCEDEYSSRLIGSRPNQTRLEQILKDVEALEFDYSECTFFYVYVPYQV